MKRRVAGFALNAFLRASIAAFLVDTLRHPHDPRYEGKAIPIRNLLVVGGLVSPSRYSPSGNADDRQAPRLASLSRLV